MILFSSGLSLFIFSMSVMQAYLKEFTLVYSTEEILDLRYLRDC